MVEDTFNSHNRTQFIKNGRNEIDIEQFKDPIMELIDSLKNSIRQYNQRTQSHYSLKIIEDNRIIGNIIA